MHEAQIAVWMLSKIKRHVPLHQSELAVQLHREHGGAVTYINKNGNLAISKALLKEFRRISGDAIVWDRGSRCWRVREARDGAGRQAI